MNSKPENNIGNIGNRERRIEILTIIKNEYEDHTYIQIEDVRYLRK